jgi:hypothetical protein
MEDDLDLLRNITILSLSGDPRADEILRQLNQVDPARAQAIQRQVQVRQNILEGPAQRFGTEEQRSAPNAFRDAVNSGARSVGNFLNDVFQSTQNLNVSRDPEREADKAELQAASDLSRDTGGDPFQGAPNLPQAVQGIQDLIDPVGQAQQALVEANAAQQLQTEQLRALQLANASVPTLAPTPASNPSGITNPAVALQQETDALNYVANQNALINQYRQAQQAQQALLLDSANQQGVDIANRENLNRLREQISLIQTPQVGNFLNAAAAGAQTPTITGTPANVTQNLALTQAIAPQIQVPSLAAAAKTNINQQNRADRINQNAQEAQQKQQLRALQLAMKQFQTQIARPILTERR